MTDFRKNIIDCLMKGYNQTEISLFLKHKNITPHSLSSIEKELKLIKKDYKAKNLFHLGFIIGQNKLNNK